jgi:hypothetical protein
MGKLWGKDVYVVYLLGYSDTVPTTAAISSPLQTTSALAVCQFNTFHNHPSPPHFMLVTNFWARIKAAATTMNPVPITSLPNLVSILVLSFSIFGPSVFPICAFITKMPINVTWRPPPPK